MAGAFCAINLIEICGINIKKAPLLSETVLINKTSLKSLSPGRGI